MRKLWKQFFLAVLLGLILPYSLVAAAVRLFPLREETEPSAPPESGTAAAEAGSISLPEKSEWMIPVRLQNGETVRLELDSYLVGVVLAEMPASFEQDALKAQAVVARTFALRSGKHPGGAVCTDPACCQGYRDPDSFSDRAAVDKITNAVAETSGLVLTYEGELIEATYFSCSGGSTEDALAVWGTDVPYLRSTDSPGEENAEHFSDTVRFSAEEFARALGMEAEDDPSGWFGDVRYTAGGGVDSMEICGEAYSGTELRSLLGLRSTAFTVLCVGDDILIQSRGFGHRVGMSQYGADAMAASGCGYREILEHYYAGTTLTRIGED